MERAEHAVEPVDPPVPTVPVAPARQQPLTLSGVSDDRATLLLLDDRGASYVLPVTPALRAALRGDASRHGQLENTMDSALRPRDIQARIRAGETADSVAQAAQTTVEKIMPFVAPVLAEREHVAERAQRSNVRRPAGESGTPGGRVLGDAVETHLRSLNVDPDGVEWDAWRREDGRWTLTAGYALAVRAGTGHFTFDVRGNYVVLDDEDARWLVGEVVPAPAPARDDLQPVRERRLSTVRHDDELPLGDDAIELVAEVEAPAPAEPAEPAEATADEPIEALLDVSPASDDPALREEAAEAAAAEPEPEPVVEEPKRRPAAKRKGRASVPSWDEIMFGPGSD
jgi:hypothetical protein